MGWIDAVFGRTRMKQPKTDELVTLVTAQIDIEADLGWRPAGRAALCLKPVTTADYAMAESDLDGLVKLIAVDSRTQVKVHVDEYRYRWLLFADTDFEDLVGVIHIAAKELQAKGYGGQLLAAVYPFAAAGGGADAVGGAGAGGGGKANQFIVYSYKRGAFYPFIPLERHQRDNAAELHAAAMLEKHLPIEKDYTRWYPLWDCPV